MSSAGATIRAVHPAEPRLFSILHGAPHIHLSNLRLLGTLRSEGAHLAVTNCRMEPIPVYGQGGLTSSPQRALFVFGGRVALLQTVLTGHSAGAIEVIAAHLTVIECAVQSCQAQTGAAMIASHGAEVDVTLSLFADNLAHSSGGALQAPLF